MMIFICVYFKRRIPHQGGRCDQPNQTADAALQRDGAETDLTPFASSLFFGAAAASHIIDRHIRMPDGSLGDRTH